MNMKLLLAILAATSALSHAASWDYTINGPDTWGEAFPECAKASQSPIDITAKDAEIDYDLPIITRDLFYTPPTKMRITNNGHSLVAVFDEGAYQISDAEVLPFNAQIAQYHFHWGSGWNAGGSEHTINKKQYFGELHAVHYNTKYDNISHAIDKPDGLAVFGWFIDVDYPQPNQDMKFFLELAENGAQNYTDETNVETLFSLETLLPSDLNVYYRYPGSLTTPGCYESVTWTVFEEPIKISREQADMLASTFYKTEDYIIKDNYRPVQPLNGRKIRRPASMVQDSGANMATPSIFIATITFALALLF